MMMIFMGIVVWLNIGTPIIGFDIEKAAITLTGKTKKKNYTTNSEFEF